MTATYSAQAKLVVTSSTPLYSEGIIPKPKAHVVVTMPFCKSY
jgi:hypothetical protein